VGAEGAMAVAHSEPSSPEQKNKSGGGPGTRGAGQKGREGKWDGHGLEKLVDRRTEAKRECSVHAMAAARWQRQSCKAALGQEQSSMARAGRARREGARAALELGATRGGEVQQEVARGGRKRRAAVLQQRSRVEGGARGRRERGGPRDLFAKIEKSRDLTVN
jgi:hypothetical protein